MMVTFTYSAWNVEAVASVKVDLPMIPPPLAGIYFTYLDTVLQVFGEPFMEITPTEYSGTVVSVRAYRSLSPEEETNLLDDMKRAGWVMED